MLDHAELMNVGMLLMDEIAKKLGLRWSVGVWRTILYHSHSTEAFFQETSFIETVKPR